MKERFLVILLTFIISGCSNFDKKEYTTKDNLETAKLIRSVLSNSNDSYITLNCIREKDYHLSSILNEENNLISQYLDLNSKEELETVINLDKKFRLTPNLVGNRKILFEEELKLFQEEKGKDFLNFKDLLKCPNGYLTISKPIFNKDFDKAIIHIGQVCGFLCGSGEYRLYEFRGGNWNLKEVVSSWVS
jgi:hypothetical protein